MTLWPAGGSQPNVSSINSFVERILANNVILPASGEGSIDVYAFDRTDFIVDINGYFAPDNGQGLYYFPVTQCRANDSTVTGGIYPDDSTRTINVPTAGNCGGIPATAKGYVVNCNGGSRRIADAVHHGVSNWAGQAERIGIERISGADCDEFHDSFPRERMGQSMSMRSDGLMRWWRSVGILGGSLVLPGLPAARPLIHPHHRRYLQPCDPRQGPRCRAALG